MLPTLLMDWHTCWTRLRSTEHTLHRSCVIITSGRSSCGSGLRCELIQRKAFKGMQKP